MEWYNRRTHFGFRSFSQPPEEIRLIRRQTITAQVITYILDLIKKGQVKPGERLPTEKQLIEELSVSRTCVREAIKSLESLQLISVRPKIGAIVLEPSSDALINAEYLSTSAFMQQAESLIEFRKLLESSLVALAAEKATETDWAAMRKVLEEQEAALSMDRSTPSGDLRFHEAITSANFRFHKAVAAATRNPLAIMVLEAISKPLADVSRRTNQMPGVPEAGLRQHWAIYRAIRENNPEKARRAMLLHLKAAERNAHMLENEDHQVTHPIPPAPAGVAKPEKSL
jgi:GntR family transcriptional regulator, transcriptional repressor for pyruvate dehydrogenase complex